MNYCYICGDKLNETNKTKEHIFLEGLGDRLQSNNILCKKCNNELGETIDAPFINDLKNFVNFAQLKQDQELRVY